MRRRVLLLLCVASVALAPAIGWDQESSYPMTLIPPGKGPFTFPAGYQTPFDIVDILVKENAAMKLPGSEAITAPALVSGATGTSGIAPVTITGCLEISVDQDEFRLTETEGVDAPRSRSWRTGFLKKRSAPVALVEPPDRLALQTHVGRRVAATGLLTSHDLRVSALRVVGPTCN